MVSRSEVLAASMAARMAGFWKSCGPSSAARCCADTDRPKPISSATSSPIRIPDVQVYIFGLRPRAPGLDDVGAVLEIAGQNFSGVAAQPVVDHSGIHGAEVGLVPHVVV